MQQYPEWAGDGTRRTQLRLDYAQRIHALSEALSNFAWEIAEDDDNHPLWGLLDQFNDVLNPTVMDPLGDGRWNPRALSGCLYDGPDKIQEYLPEFFHVVRGDDANNLTVLQAIFVDVDEPTNIT